MKMWGMTSGRVGRSRGGGVEGSAVVCLRVRVARLWAFRFRCVSVRCCLCFLVCCTLGVPFVHSSGSRGCLALGVSQDLLSSTWPCPLWLSSSLGGARSAPYYEYILLRTKGPVYNHATKHGRCSRGISRGALSLLFPSPPARCSPPLFIPTTHVSCGAALSLL